MQPYKFQHSHDFGVVQFYQGLKVHEKNINNKAHIYNIIRYTFTFFN